MDKRSNLKLSTSHRMTKLTKLRIHNFQSTQAPLFAQLVDEFEWLFLHRFMCMFFIWRNLTTSLRKENIRRVSLENILVAKSCFHVGINKSVHMNIDRNSDFCKIKISEKSLHHYLKCLIDLSFSNGSTLQKQPPEVFCEKLSP